MNVKLPNGTVISGVPEGATKQEVMNKAIANGLATEADFGVEAQYIKTPEVEAQEVRVSPYLTGGYEQPQSATYGQMRVDSDDRTRAERELPEILDSGLLAGESAGDILKVTPALLTATDPNEMAQILQSNFPDIGIQYDEKGNVIAANNKTGAKTIINKPGLSKLDIMQGLGIASAFMPAGRAASIPASIAASGATEGILQGIQSASGGRFNDEDIAMAAGLGGVGKGIENVVGGVYRAARGRVPEAQRELIETGAESGVPVMTSDILEPQTFAGKMARSTGEKVPLVGTGSARAAQQEMREEAVSQFVDKFQTPSYADIVKSISDKSTRVKRAAGNVLSKTGNTLDELGDIPVDNTRKAITDAIDELSKPNVRVDQQAIDELIQLEDLMNMPQTFSSLKENRTIFRDIVDSFGKGERSQLPTRSKSLLQKAGKGMTDDMDSFAKQNLSSKDYSSWKKANAVYADEATKLKKSRIKNILDKGDVSPENVSTMLFSQKPSEVKVLYDSLTTEGKRNARSALIYRAFDNASKRSGGISPNSFSSELNKITKNTDVFFKGQDKKQLEGFKRLLEATRRAQDAAVETPTGQQLLGAGAGYAAFTDLGATLGLGGTAGGLARLYESAPVRNALLRLGSVPKGSDKYLKALFEAQAALTSAAQGLRSTEEGLR